MPDDGGWQVRVECSAVKQLPTPLVNRLGGKSSIHLRVQGSVGGARRETGPSTWGGKGTPRAGEGVWSREDGCLIWNFDSIESLKELERRSPKLKLHCYATRGMEPSLQDSEALGSVVLEVADIRRHPQPGSIWAKLKGTNESTAELLYSARVVRRREEQHRATGGEGAREKNDRTELRSSADKLPAKRLGKGETVFELCVSLEDAGALIGLVGPELQQAPHRKYWFSLEIFGVVLQTEQFSLSSEKTPPFAVECDWFRLKGSAHELASVLANVVQVFLCTDGLVVAAGLVSLGPLLPLDSWHPARQSQDFYASEHRFRVDIDSRRPSAAAASVSTGRGWLQIFAKLRRFGPTDKECEEKRGPRGWLPPSASENDDGNHLKAVDVIDVPSPSVKPPPPLLSAETRSRWRLVIELLRASFSPTSGGGPLHFRYGAESLGQRGVAKTARIREPSSLSSRIAIRGKGAKAMFEFSRLSAIDLCEDYLQKGLKIELAGDDGVPLADVDLDLTAPLLTGEKFYKSSGTISHVFEQDYAMNDGYSMIRAKLILEETLDDETDQRNSLAKKSKQKRSPAAWSETVAERLVGSSGAQSSYDTDDAETDDEDEESGVGGGNMPSSSSRGPPRSRRDACSACGAPSDWATRQTDAAIEAERRVWEEWRDAEEAVWAGRLRRKETERMRVLEEEAEKARKAEREEFAATRAEYAKLEAKLRTSLRDVEQRERNLNDADAALQRERGVRVSELQLLERRLRDETRHAVEAEKRQTKAIEKALTSQKAATERAERRAQTAEAEFDRWRAAHRRTPEAELAGRLAKAKAEAADLSAKVERGRAETAEANAERERLRAQVHRLAKALKRARDEANDKARRDLDELRLEYRGREERFVLDGDRAQLKNIKSELDSLRRANTDGATYAQVAQKAAEYTLASAFQARMTQSTIPTSGGIPAPAGAGNATTAAASTTRTIPTSLHPVATAQEGKQEEPATTEGSSVAMAPPEANFESPPRSAAAAEDDIDEVFQVINSPGYRGGAPAIIETDPVYERLVAERKTLVDDAGYPLDDPVVKDLDRLIQAARHAIENENVVAMTTTTVGGGDR